MKYNYILDEWKLDVNSISNEDTRYIWSLHSNNKHEICQLIENFTEIFILKKLQVDINGKYPEKYI